MRNEVVFYLNGKRTVAGSNEAGLMLSDLLRYERGLPGTKVVCAEGDCGACTVLVSRFKDAGMTEFRSINSCIAPVYSLDRSSVITVEGLKKDGALHPVQEAMVREQGSQCGYCTPGFICSLAGMLDSAKKKGFEIDQKRVRNHTTGNLCRCTGYQPILNAGLAVDPASVPALSIFHNEEVLIRDFKALSQTVVFGAAGEEVFLPGELAEALRLKRQYPDAKIVSGMTDLGVLTNKGKLAPGWRIALHQIAELGRIEMGSDDFLIGARVTLSDLEEALEAAFPEFSKLLRIFASPQIKHSATLAGNLMNASPIGDTPPFLRAAGASVILSRWGDSGAIERREVPIDHFIKGGYKELDTGKDEVLTAIRIPKSDHRYALFKTSTRKDLDISTVTFAARYRIASGKLEGIRIVYGGVGPSVARFEDLEAMLEGRQPDPALFTQVADLAQTRVSPLSDVRGSATFRKVLVRNLMLKFGDRILAEVGVPKGEALV